MARKAVHTDAQLDMAGRLARERGKTGRREHRAVIGGAMDRIGASGRRLDAEEHAMHEHIRQALGDDPVDTASALAKLPPLLQAVVHRLVEVMLGTVHGLRIDLLAREMATQDTMRIKHASEIAGRQASYEELMAEHLRLKEQLRECSDEQAHTKIMAAEALATVTERDQRIERIREEHRGERLEWQTRLDREHEALAAAVRRQEEAGAALAAAQSIATAYQTEFARTAGSLHDALAQIGSLRTCVEEASRARDNAREECASLRRSLEIALAHVQEERATLSNRGSHGRAGKKQPGRSRSQPAG